MRFSIFGDYRSIVPSTAISLGCKFLSQWHIPFELGGQTHVDTSTVLRICPPLPQCWDTQSRVCKEPDVSMPKQLGTYALAIQVCQACGLDSSLRDAVRETT